MRKLLIILTRKYPYAFGEPFLESEINIQVNLKNIQQENLILHSDAFYATLNLGVLG